jgi:hypothetical protein
MWSAWQTPTAVNLSFLDRTIHVPDKENEEEFASSYLRNLSLPKTSITKPKREPC